MAIFGDLERLIDDIYPYRWLIVALAAIAISLLATTLYRRGWHRKLQRHKRRTALVTVPLLIVAIPLSYYLLSPLWTRTTIYEESPLAAASRNTIPGVPAATSPPTAPVASATTLAATPTTAPIMPTATTDPSHTIPPEPTATAELNPSEEPTQEPRIEPTPEPTMEPVPEPTAEPITPRLVSSGPLRGADDFHFAEGTALLIETAPGVYVLRLEAFSVRNGPDLFVYLAPSPDQLDDTAINLGGLRATDGSINYDIPPGTDITRFPSVVIWCRAFSVLFGSAPLIPA